MTYTKDTKLSEIKNAETIANATKANIDLMLKNCKIADFVKWNEKRGRNEIRTESLSTLCGTSSGAIANRIAEQKGADVYEKIGLFLGSWTKGGNKLTITEIAKQAENNAKLSMAKNMLSLKLDVKQIATVTGLTIEEINALNA